ncbi:hypothetical protein AAG906_031299 [Vitis piasezkii]
MVLFYFCTVPTSLHSLASGMTVFDGSNFSEWYERVQFSLGVLDLDLALITDKPPEATDDSTQEQTSLPQTKFASEFLKSVEECFKRADKSLAGTLMAELTTMKYDGQKGIQQHILNMSEKATKLKALGMGMDESFLVQFVLNSLPSQFAPFKIHYNTNSDQWNLNELTSKCIQEEVRLRQEGHNLALAVTHGVTKKKGKFKKGKNFPPKKSGPREGSQSHDGKFTISCYFCGKKGHVKKDCIKRKAWFEKRGINISFVCYESNLAEVPSNTWWIDSGATTHVTNLIEKFLYMGNRLKVEVVVVGTYRLLLEMGHQMDLLNTFYVPSISRNLVSLSKLDATGYSVLFSSGQLSLMLNSITVGSGILCDGLYKISLNHEFAQALITLHSNVGSKRGLINENSSILWHRRLGHISRERIERLVKEGILQNLDFTDFHVCVDCIKGKQTKHTKKGATRTNELLEIIHTDICGPLSIPCFTGEKYFITFIDDLSHYGYVYLMHEKSQAIDIFEMFIIEVERQLDKKIKIVRSYRGGEYYGAYDESDKILNGVAERCNRTLMEMVRSMMSYSSYLFHYRFQEGAQNSFRVMDGRKPSLRHIHIWGCPMEARIYNPHEKKLDSRMISGYFIGYLDKSKGHDFIVLTTNGEIDGSNEPRKVDIEEIRVDIPPSFYLKKLLSSTCSTKPPQPAPLRRSQRERRPAITDDYVVYLQESDFDIGIRKDPISFSQAMESDDSSKWMEAMNEELKSMAHNGVWDLIELPNNCKPVDCKWVFKTKRNAKGNIERFKARLVAKGFTQKEGIDYKDTFSPVSKKDSLRIIMALVAHFDLELHQMDVKTTFLNGNLDEDIYMEQPEGFVKKGNEHLVSKLKKSIYGLKQASRQWYIKFNNTITYFGFKENIVDKCIYLKVSGSKFIFLILYVDDILLASSDLGLLRETKEYLSKNFHMVDMGEANYVIGIEIFRDRSRGVLGLSQKGYIDRVLERFNMQSCSSGIAPILKGDKLSKMQAQGITWKGQMKKIPYASAMGEDTKVIRFEHWKAAKKVMRYLQGTKDYILTYKRSEQLEVVGYSDSDYGGCLDSLKSTSICLYASKWGNFVEDFKSCLMVANFISWLGVVDSIAKPLRISCDNTWIKHMDLKYLVVKERVRNNDSSLAMKWQWHHRFGFDPNGAI